jgi:hypothetical protein
VCIYNYLINKDPIQNFLLWDINDETKSSRPGLSLNNLQIKTDSMMDIAMQFGENKTIKPGSITENQKLHNCKQLYPKEAEWWVVTQKVKIVDLIQDNTENTDLQNIYRENAPTIYKHLNQQIFSRQSCINNKGKSLELGLESDITTDAYDPTNEYRTNTGDGGGAWLGTCGNISKSKQTHQPVSQPKQVNLWMGYKPLKSFKECSAPPEI